MGNRNARGAIGFKAHIGWAYAVVVAQDDGGVEVVAKQRVTMLETFETAAVYHQGHERGLSAEQARPMIDSALRESAARAKAAIASLAASVAGRCRLERAALLAGSGRPLPPLEAVLRSHPLVHAAEGEMYRDAVGRACEALGLSLLRLPAKELHERAATTLGMKETALRARLAAAITGGSTTACATRTRRHDRSRRNVDRPVGSDAPRSHRPAAPQAKTGRGTLRRPGDEPRSDEPASARLAQLRVGRGGPRWPGRARPHVPAAARAFSRVAQVARRRRGLLGARAGRVPRGRRARPE